jgi:Tfp pilus assembly protein PilE
MMGMTRGILRREQSYTIVELLIIITIMALLIGIVSLAVNCLSTNTATGARAAELDQVQTAVDIYLAVNYPGITTVAAQTVPGPVTTTADFSEHMRSLPTKYNYTWDPDGNVAQH